MKSFPAPKFDPTVTVSFHLTVDPRKSDQMVRGSVSLPNGTGKNVRVLVFAQGDAAKAAQEEVEGNRPNPELLHCTVPPKSGM